MKMPKRLVIIGAIAAVVCSLTSFNGASAQTILTEEQLQRISANCLSIKNTLNQLHVSDALLRVNRGQIYEAMGAKLMNNFNSRLTSNGKDTKGLLVVTSGYQTALDTFRSDYREYESKLSVAIKIDCNKQPAEFHAAIQEARAKRTTLHADVLRLHRYIDDYRSGVSDFLINFERTSGGKS